MFIKNIFKLNYFFVSVLLIGANSYVQAEGELKNPGHSSRDEVSLQGKITNRRMTSTDEVSKEDRIVHALLNSMAKKLSKKYQMQLAGTGVSMPNNILKMLGLNFDVYRPLSKEEIRKILVESVEEFLQAANSDQEMRPLMKMYPFTPENIEVVIVVYPSKKLYDPDIGIASAREGVITYRTYDPEKKFDYKSETEESFAEASRIVHAN